MDRPLFWRDTSQEQKLKRVHEPLREAAVMAIQYGIPVEQAVRFLREEYDRLVLRRPAGPGNRKEKVTV